MKKIIFSAIGVVGLIFVVGNVVFAQAPLEATPLIGQGMMGQAAATDEHTAREEAEGKIVWEKLQAKEIACADVSDENFETLGEYFMGIMMGDSHAAMNAMMIQAHGEEWEEQVHSVMGRRLSGCDTSAAFPSQGTGFGPMMNMMWGGWSSPAGLSQENNSMMNFGFMPFGWFGWIFMILWWALIIAGVVALIKWIAGESRSGRASEKSALDILKARYAKGEIDKKEFEEKSREIKNL